MAVVSAYGVGGSEEQALEVFLQLIAQGKLTPPEGWQAWLAMARDLPPNWLEFKEQWQQILPAQDLRSPQNQIAQGRYEANRIQEFMLTLEFYTLLLMQRIYSFLPLLLLSLPCLGVLFYSLKLRRSLQQEQLVYTSPLKKTMYVYLMGICLWGWLVLWLIPLPLPSACLTLGYISVLITGYKLRQLVQVSQQQATLNLN
ncbi:hypothetical protein CKF59_01760 [Psittacicella gerlachiana]|uniref:Uncharacterized protein n=2 Tax=Psittacicella gerlachiana TaxID=2028574 RepID=A0A3A1YJ34_9GAMM|nr:hypothetical protein CKF59_01760 [Psittacicella gerlachiana]